MSHKAFGFSWENVETLIESYASRWCRSAERIVIGADVMTPGGWMSAETQIIETIDMLTVHEQCLGRLYRAYAAIFPAHADMWSKLCREEAGHASYLRVLRNEVLAGVAIAMDAQFSPEGIASSQRFVEQQIDNARVQNVDIVEALSTAYDLETALIEKRLVTAFQSNDVRVLRIMRRLESDTRDHVSLVRNAWQSLQRKAA